MFPDFISRLNNDYHTLEHSRFFLASREVYAAVYYSKYRVNASTFSRGVR
jgi:hypothetical protein